VSKSADDEEPARHWVPVNPTLVQKLSIKSAERVSKSSKFAEIKKEVEDNERNKGVIRLADLRKKIKAENKEEKKWLKSWKHDHSKEKLLENPLIAEGESILTDWIAMSDTSRALGSNH